MIIYQFFDGESSCVFPSKREAVSVARQLIREGHETDIEIEKVTVPKLTKSLLIDVINSQGGSYVKASEVVQVIKSKFRKTILKKVS